MKKMMRMPTYLKDFRCIAEKCEDTCCAGFVVPVDRYTAEKYEVVKDEGVKSALMESVEKNPNAKADNDYAYINATCACPFLDGDGLCGIQKNLGESFLSSACSKYPQHISVVDTKGEKWATLSCPEVSRMVLLNKEKLTFEEREVEVDANRDVATFQLQTGELPMTRYFYELRNFTISILQDRSMKLEMRMKVLREFYGEVTRLTKDGREAEIPELIATFESERRFSLEDEEFDMNKFFDTLIGLRQKNVFVRRYEEVFQEMVVGFDGDIDTTGLDFISEHDYLLENYLVHYVFQRLFPFSYGETMYDAFKMMELQYDMLRVHIMGVGSCHGKMDEHMVVRVVQSFVKEAEHNTVFLPTLFDSVASRK